MTNRILILIIAWHISTIFYCPSLKAAQTQTPPVLFVDKTQEAGLPISNQRSFSSAVADYNQDGYLDLLNNHHSILSLWQNNGNSTFSDTSSIMDVIQADKHGVSFVDLNKDGYDDIAISVGAGRGRGKGKNIYLLNEQGKKFTRAPSVDPFIEDEKGRGRSIVPVDINRDGDIDLLLLNYVAKATDPPHRLALSKNLGPNTSQFSESRLGEEFSMSEAFGCSVVNLDNSNELSFILTGLGHDAGKIFQRKNGILTNVTRELGITPEGCLTVTPIDYDNDGDLDLFYGRGLPPPSSSIGISNGMLKFVINDSNKALTGFKSLANSGMINVDIRFEQKADTAYLHLGADKKTIPPPLQIDLSDTKLQGEPKIDPARDLGGFLWRDAQTGHLNYRFIGSDALQETEGVIKPIDFKFTTIEYFNIAPPGIGTPQYKNSLYKNDKGHFVDVAQQAGILGGGQTFTSLAADFNNDGFQDIYAVNIGQSFDNLNPPNHLFINNGDGTFSETAAQSGAAGPPTGIGSGVIAFDYDGDGKLDIFLHNGNVAFPNEPGPLVLLKNSTTTVNQSLQITLKGLLDTQGWGTKIYAHFLNNTTLLLQQFALNGYLSASDLPIHIGLGQNNKIDNLHIEWPSGKQQDLLHVAGPTLTISEAR